MAVSIAFNRYRIYTSRVRQDNQKEAEDIDGHRIENEIHITEKRKMHLTRNQERNRQ